MPLLLGLLPAIIPVLLWLIETFVLNKSQDRESRELFIKLAQLLRSLGVKNAKSRFESAAEQSQAGNAEWDKREQEQKPEEKQ